MLSYLIICIHESFGFVRTQSYKGPFSFILPMNQTVNFHFASYRIEISLRSPILFNAFFKGLTLGFFIMALRYVLNSQLLLSHAGLGSASHPVFVVSLLILQLLFFNVL